MDNTQILDLFVGRSMIDGALKADILSEIENSGKEAAEILADYQVVNSRDDIWPMIAQELGAEFIDLNEFSPPEALLSLIPAGVARLHGALPISYDDDGIAVALTDPLNPQILEDLRFAVGQELKLVVGADYLVEQKINELYGGEEKAMDDILSQLDGHVLTKALSTSEYYGGSFMHLLLKEILLVLSCEYLSLDSLLRFPPSTSNILGPLH